MYPPHSLVHNIGNDGSGTNSSSSKIYDNILRNVPIKLENIPIVEDKNLRNEFENYFLKIIFLKSLLINYFKMINLIKKFVRRKIYYKGHIKTGQ